MVIVYQSDNEDEEASLVVEAYKTRSGLEHELACGNPKDPERGNCPIQWQIVFFSESEDGERIRSSYDSAEIEGPSSLIKNVGGKSF